MEGDTGISVSQLFALLVLQMRLSPQYVLDEMTDYELKALLDNADMAIDKYSLELLRLNAFVTAKCAGSKVQLTDVAKFPWENKMNRDAEQLSVERVEALRKKAQLLKKHIDGHDHNKGPDNGRDK